MTDKKEKLYTEDQMLKMVKSRIKKLYGNVNRFADACGVDCGNAYNVCNGNANIMDSVINPLGYEVVPQPNKYRRISKGEE